MSITKTITVDGKSVILEKRYCLNKRCNAEFWIKKEATSGICSIACWEIVNDRMWLMNKKNLCRMPFYPVDNEERQEKAIADAKKRREEYNSRIDKAVKKRLRGE